MAWRVGGGSLHPRASRIARGAQETPQVDPFGVFQRIRLRINPGHRPSPSRVVHSESAVMRCSFQRAGSDPLSGAGKVAIGGHPLATHAPGETPASPRFTTRNQQWIELESHQLSWPLGSSPLEPSCRRVTVSRVTVHAADPKVAGLSCRPVTRTVISPLAVGIEAPTAFECSKAASPILGRSQFLIASRRSIG